MHASNAVRTTAANNQDDAGMTRETKVGLLVGMGVILLIGIIISDHLSVAQHQSPADMTGAASRAQESINPLVRADDVVPEPVPASRGESVLQRVQPLPTPNEMQTPPWRPVPEDATAPPPPAELPRAFVAAVGSTTLEGANNDTQRPRPQDGVQDRPIPSLTLSHESPGSLFEPTPTSAAPATLGMNRVQPTNPAALFNPTNNATPGPSTSEIIHYVEPGETLYQIARKYYGNGDYWRIIAEHNRGRVRENGQVGQNVRLVIPNRAGMIDFGPDFIPVAREGVRPLAVQVQRQAPAQTIEVQPGDTLSRLAARHLGDANRWREIMDANSDQLSRPEALRVGMTLKLPGGRVGSTGGTAAATVQPVAPRPTPATQQAATDNATASNTTPNNPGREYTVEAGDNLTRIAVKTLGDGDRWREIYEANRDRLSSPDAIVVGQKLRIP
jgi:nucleoid-associated protein YgaU